MWSKSGFWLLRVRIKKMRFTLPFPMYVVAEVLESFADLGALILPRLGKPNYPGLLLEACEALNCSPDTPLVDVDTGDVLVQMKRLGRK